MSRLDRVLAAVRAWRKVPAEASTLKEEIEMAAAIDDLDAFTAKPTEPALAAVSVDEPPKTDRNT